MEKINRFLNQAKQFCQKLSPIERINYLMILCTLTFIMAWNTYDFNNLSFVQTLDMFLYGLVVGGWIYPNVKYLRGKRK